jgi:hypothetical protein
MPIRDIAEVIGRHLDLPVVAIAPEDAAGHFGFLDGFPALDIPASSALTRELTGREPTHPAHGTAHRPVRDQVLARSWPGFPADRLAGLNALSMSAFLARRGAGTAPARS